MFYASLSLNGTWEMNYKENIYTGVENPWNLNELDLVARSAVVKNAVPGYWEDMTETFLYTPFCRYLKVNPEFGIQRYPMAGDPADMALPNIFGNFFYRRSFFCEESEKEAVIHFDGVQNSVSVWINDVFLGRHEGYSTPFDMQIPKSVLKCGENCIALSVSNYRLTGYADEPVSGITSRAANEGTGGITGNVELRFYNSPLRDATLFVSDDCSEIKVSLDIIQKNEFSWLICDGRKILKSGSAEGDFTFDTEGLKRWSPENPKLYTLKLVCGDAILERRFGVRRLLPDGPHFRLNGKPYFLRGICEHCYFPETIHPAHDLTYYRSIIRSVKELGFNFIRFHTYIPEEEYMQAADELGMLLHVECPNNTALEEWKEIIGFCRRHTSVVIYCCGNELQMDDAFIKHLEKCAEEVHKNTDALFSPMSAMRGLEYAFLDPGQEKEIVEEPFRHHPRRFKTVGKFSDMYSSYPTGFHSYFSLKCDPKSVDERSSIYGDKPRVSHEICIDGTYADLSLKDRYKNTRVEKTEMFSSIEKHLDEKGVLKRAPLYFKNSSQWQRRVRKYCFEALRRSDKIAGYDFLGPIDTHWHTFGYDVGMMNEFYELKPGETVRNVRMYNSETVLLTDLARKVNFKSGEELSCGVFCSCYADETVRNASVAVRLMLDEKAVVSKNIPVGEIENGKVSKLCDLSVKLPCVEKPSKMKLSITLDGDSVFAENEWELYIFPEVENTAANDVVVSYGMSGEELLRAMKSRKDVLLLGAEPFVSLPTSFRIGLAGRTSGNLATVIADHPALGDMPHEGFCGWQFSEMMDDGAAICFECPDVPFDPIVEVVSTHKYVIRQAAMFEFNVCGGRLLVCGFKFPENDPAAQWLKNQLITYMQSDAFSPVHTLEEKQLNSLISCKVSRGAENKNFACNSNDITSKRKNNAV